MGMTMTNEELIAQTRKRLVDHPHGWLPSDVTTMRRLAAALEASQPRVVTTIEELNALPVSAALHDRTRDVWVKGATRWWSTNPYDAKRNNSPAKMLPMTVLWTPEATR